MLNLFLLNFCVAAWNINQFGAKPDEVSLKAALANGEAFNKAVLAANSSESDKTAVIPGGRFYIMLPAGTVSNLVNVVIVIDGKVEAWHGDHSDWPKNSNGGVLPLFSLEYTQNLTVTGSGQVNGYGYNWWWHTILTGEDNRPIMFQLYHAVDTLIEKVTFKNAAKFHLSLLDLFRATIKNLIIHVDITNDRAFLNWIPTFPLNTDGIDISGKDIYFTNLTIQNFDDAIAVKPLHEGSSIYSNCTQNILIENCYVKYGVGMSIGSVPPNDNLNCVRNITIRGIYFDSPLKAIYVKPNPGTHGKGLIANVLYENIEIHNALWWAIWVGTQQQNQPGAGADTGCSFFYPLPGAKCPTDPLVTVDSLILRNINIYGGALSPGILICNATNPCTNFVFDNVNVYNRSHFPVAEGYMCRHIEGYAKNSNIYPNCLTDITSKKGFLSN